jgi:putative flippase GtrA
MSTDALSLLFIACIVFPATFLIITTLLGLGHSHTDSIGGHHADASIGTHSHMDAGSHDHAHVATHHAEGQGSQHDVSGSEKSIISSSHLGMRVTIGQHPKGSQVSLITGDGPWYFHLFRNIGLNAILVFLFSFGLLGYLLKNNAHVPAIIAAIASTIVGLGAGYMVNRLYKWLFGREVGQLGYGSSEIIGRIAKVSIAIRAGGIGEIIYVGDHGSRHSLGARSVTDTPIAQETEVVIVDQQKGIAFVQGWDDFLSENKQARLISDISVGM